MKKFLVPLLALVLLCMSMSVLAEGNEAVTLEVTNTKLPIYAAGDPYLDGLLAEPDNALPVLVLPVKAYYQMAVSVQPKTLKNKQVVLSVDNEELVRVRGNMLTGLQAGETVLTIASAQDPAATLQYRVLVVQPVTRITVTASDKVVSVGQTVSLTADFLPEGATMKQVVWSSSDEKTATVDANGTVTGVKRGGARIIATAADGSNIRANISIQVVQNPEEITLDKAETFVDIGKTAVLKATVLPKDANDRNVIWSSSDESIAKVNNQGRITGVALGDCEIICTSKVTGDVQAKAVVHVQQPVKKVTFGDVPAVYVGETAKLSWSIEPADATNQALSFTSSKESVLTVSDDGTVTGVKAGEAYVRAITTDGSNRQARILVKVYQHVTGVHMKRDTAYLDPRESATAGAVLEPETATNHNMTWEVADPSVATVEPVAKQTHRVRITGVSEGETVVTGTTEDGGYQTQIRVVVGDFSHATKITNAEIDGKGRILVTVKNISDNLTLSNITLEIETYGWEGEPVISNAKDGTNIIKAVYSKPLEPGKSTPEDQWKLKDLDDSAVFASLVVRLTEYQINNDWVKVLWKSRQPKFEYIPE